LEGDVTTKGFAILLRGKVRASAGDLETDAPEKGTVSGKPAL